MTTVEDGFEQLGERISECFERLSTIEIVEGSPILADDRFFHPVFRTLSQDVSQCLLSALDHLRFLVLRQFLENLPKVPSQRSKHLLLTSLRDKVE